MIGMNITWLTILPLITGKRNVSTSDTNCTSLNKKLHNVWSKHRESLQPFKTWIQNTSKYQKLTKQVNLCNSKIRKASKHLFHRSRNRYPFQVLNDSVIQDSNITVKNFWHCWNRVTNKSHRVQDSAGNWLLTDTQQIQEFERVFHNKFTIQHPQQYQQKTQQASQILQHECQHLNCSNPLPPSPIKPAAPVPMIIYL